MTLHFLILAVVGIALFLVPTHPFRTAGRWLRERLTPLRPHAGRLSRINAAGSLGSRTQPPARKSQLTQEIDWHRLVDPRETYRIAYIDRDGQHSERIVDLIKVGTLRGEKWYGVIHAGKFKTLRADRIRDAVNIVPGLPNLMAPLPTYADELPLWPGTQTVLKMPTIAAGNKTWTVDLSRYTCTCPEKRVRSALGYIPPQLGNVCPHMARAICQNLPPEAAWPEELLAFLSNPKKTAVENLI